MVRLLPCGAVQCKGGPAILPDGVTPYILGRSPSHFPFSYKCGKCKRTTTLSAIEWSRLPLLTLSNLKSLPGPENQGTVDLSHLLTQDLLGAGMSAPQIETAAEAVGTDLHLLFGRS